MDLMGEDVSRRLSSNWYTQGFFISFWTAKWILKKSSSCKQLSGWGCEFLPYIKKNQSVEFSHFSRGFVLKNTEKQLRGNSRKERDGLFCSAVERAAWIPLPVLSAGLMPLSKFTLDQIFPSVQTISNPEGVGWNQADQQKAITWWIRQ